MNFFYRDSIKYIVLGLAHVFFSLSAKTQGDRLNKFRRTFKPLIDNFRTVIEEDSLLIFQYSSAIEYIPTKRENFIYLGNISGKYIVYVYTDFQEPFKIVFSNPFPNNPKTFFKKMTYMQKVPSMEGLWGLVDGFIADGIRTVLIKISPIPDFNVKLYYIVYRIKE